MSGLAGLGVFLEWLLIGILIAFVLLSVGKFIAAILQPAKPLLGFLLLGCAWVASAAYLATRFVPNTEFFDGRLLFVFCLGFPLLVAYTSCRIVAYLEAASYQRSKTTSPCNEGPSTGS